MAAPVIENILADYQADLEAISIANGYNTDMAQVTRLGVIPQDAVELPLISFLGLEDENDYAKVSGGTSGVVRVDTTVTLGVYMSNDSNDPEKDILGLVADIEKASETGYDRGGNAWMTKVLTKKIALLEEDEPIVAALITVGIRYRRKFKEPETIA